MDWSSVVQDPRETSNIFQATRGIINHLNRLVQTFASLVDFLLNGMMKNAGHISYIFLILSFFEPPKLRFSPGCSASLPRRRWMETSSSCNSTARWAEWGNMNAINAASRKWFLWVCLKVHPKNILSRDNYDPFRPNSHASRYNETPGLEVQVRETPTSV